MQRNAARTKLKVHEWLRGSLGGEPAAKTEQTEGNGDASNGSGVVELALLQPFGESHLTPNDDGSEGSDHRSPTWSTGDLPLVLSPYPVPNGMNYILHLSR